jgi:hypothetical protein
MVDHRYHLTVLVLLHFLMETELHYFRRLLVSLVEQYYPVYQNHMVHMKLMKEME